MAIFLCVNPLNEILTTSFGSLDESQKRELTPSKSLVEPASKRVQSRQKLSGRFCKERGERLQSVLKENFVESPGKQATQEAVLCALQLTEKKKGLATHAVAKTFTSSKLNKRRGVYTNIKKAVSFNREDDKSGTITVDAESEIAKVQALIAESRRRRGNELLEDIIAKVTTGETNALEALLLAYKRETELLATRSEMLDKIYERELQFLIRTN